MNAFRDIAGVVGNVADATLLGGAVGRQRRRNAFADMLGSGDYQGASDLALRHGRGDLAQYAAQQGSTQAQAAQKRQLDQASVLGRVAQFGDSLPPDARLGYAQSIAPILQSQFDLDDEDVQAIMQAAQVPQGFGALAAAFIDPNQQVQNRFEDRKITEAGRAAQASERLRAGELGVSQGRLGLDREKFGLEQEQAPVKAAGEQQKLAREDFKDTQALRKEFSQITSDYRDARGSYDRIKTLAGQKTSQSDLALIVAFTKLLDPGSVAREGEVQLTVSSQSAVQQVGNWYNRLAEGKTILPEAVRANFVKAADEIIKSYDNSFKLRSNEFSEIANDAGLNPERVIVGGPANVAGGGDDPLGIR